MHTRLVPLVWFSILAIGGGLAACDDGGGGTVELDVEGDATTDGCPAGTIDPATTCSTAPGVECTNVPDPLWYCRCESQTWVCLGDSADTSGPDVGDPDTADAPDPDTADGSDAVDVEPDITELTDASDTAGCPDGTIAVEMACDAPPSLQCTNVPPPYWYCQCQGGAWACFYDTVDVGPDAGELPPSDATDTPPSDATDVPPSDADADVGAVCGDGFVGGAETCDEGSANSILPGAPCRPDCTLPGCGDGVVDTALGEACDDANTDDADGCDTSCALTAPGVVVASPAAIDLGSFAPTCEGPPPPQPLMLTNVGSSPVELLEIALVGCPASVSLANAPALPAPLLVDAALGLDVTYTASGAEVIACQVRVTTGSGSVLYVPVTGLATDVASQIDSITQTPSGVIDFLFVLDTSGSMQDNLADLSAALPAFAQAATSNGLDYHFGAIVMLPDTSGTMLLGELLGDPPFVTGADPMTASQAMTSIIDDAPMLGGLEVPFDATLAALQPPLVGIADPLGCASCQAPDICASSMCVHHNEGFHRPHASLDVLYVTDEDDGSTVSQPAFSAWLADQVDRRQGGLARVHTLVPSSVCGGAGAPPLLDAARSASGGRTGDLCAPEAFLVSLAGESFGLRTQFPLTRVPDPATLVVTVDGLTEPGTTWDAASNTITLPSAPAAGAVVEASYDVACAP